MFAILAASLMVVGAATLLRGLLLADKIEERDSFEIHTRHKIAAVGIGATTGFVIGLSSAGSGTLIAIMLISVFRLTPQRVVGTDVFHAAVLLWAAGIAHIFSGNVDFFLAGNILLGSVPGVILGSNNSVKWPQGLLRTALGLILIAAGRDDHEQGQHRPDPLRDGRGVARDHRPVRDPDPAPQGSRGRPRRAGGAEANQ